MIYTFFIESNYLFYFQLKPSLLYNNMSSSATSTDSFREEFQTNHLVKGEPECMKNRPALDGKAPVLTASEFDDAKAELIKSTFTQYKFPKVQRFRVDPPINQMNYYSLHSFTPSPGAKADEDGCFGVVKFRGAFGTLEEADAWAEHLIRNVDSLHEIHIGYIGKEFPLTLDPLYFNETHEVNLKKKMDTVAKAHVKASQDKEKQDIDNLKKREKELLNSSKQSPDEMKVSLDHYIALKVKCANILLVRDETMKKLEAYEQSKREAEKEIDALNEQYPEYAAQVLPTFMKSLEEVGIKDTPLLKYMQ